MALELETTSSIAWKDPIAVFSRRCGTLTGGCVADLDSMTIRPGMLSERHKSVILYFVTLPYFI